MQLQEDNRTSQSAYVLGQSMYKNKCLPGSCTAIKSSISNDGKYAHALLALSQCLHLKKRETGQWLEWCANRSLTRGTWPLNPGKNQDTLESNYLQA